MQPDLASLTFIAQQTTNVVVITDRDGHCVWVNESFTRHTGYNLAEMLGRRPGSVLQGPGTDATTVARIGRAVRAGREFDEELLNYTKQGRPYWVSIKCSPIRDQSGAITNFVAIQSDITALRAQIDELRHSSESLRTIMATMPLVVFATDDQGRLTLLEGQGLERLGVSAGQLIGCSAFALVPDPEIERNIRQALTGRAFMANVVVEELVFETRYSPLLAPDGTVTGCLGVALDVTEQVQATAELVRAKDAAEAATRAKSAFLATMSHEIRTPLNAVIGTADLLLDLASSEEQRRFAETIRTSGDMLLAVIDDILDFSKIEAGNMELEQRPFDLRATVGEVVELLAPRASAKGLGLAAAIDAAVPAVVSSDPTRIRQILVNLVGNALKFTERGEVLIRASCRPAGDGTLALELSVSDTGIGIPADRLSRLFQPFSQVDASTTRRYGGTGLGLAISKRLSELMGGRIEVRSAPGLGSTFTVQLPVLVATARGPEQGRPPGRPTEQVVPLRILIAEDNTINQQVALRMLERLGYRADLAENGLAVLRALEAGVYDVVLMDVQMPDLDGLETTRRLRATLPAQRQPWVIAMTANAMVGDRDACLAAGMDDYISKPVLRENLAAALRRVRPLAAPARLPEDDPLDRGTLRRLRADLGPDFAEDLSALVETYRRQLQLDLASLRAAQQRGDREQVALLAHRLRGASATLGARKAEQICRALEQGEPHNDEIAALVDALERAGERAAQALMLVASGGELAA